jgi:hypothetical protein
MADTHITLAWILQMPRERAGEYIMYGLGQEKLHIAHLESETGLDEDERRQMMELIQLKKAWLGSQRRDFLTRVELGSWSGHSTREMAEESGCDGLYRFVYAPFSSAVHSMWNHVSVYNLRHCWNPLHKFHRVPSILDMPIDADFVYRSAKYLSRSYSALDERWGLRSQAELPADWLARGLNALGRSPESGEGAE